VTHARPSDRRTEESDVTDRWRVAEHPPCESDDVVEIEELDRIAAGWDARVALLVP
jgi:hypothetical protein